MNLKKDTFWNTIGSFGYLGSLWLMTVIIARYGGFEQAGWFSVAMTNANIYISIASYTLRLYYAADISCKYSDKQYFCMRLFTTFISIILCAITSIAVGYSSKQLVIIFLFYIYKVFEMLSDILYGALQRIGKLYISGYSLSLKSVLSLVLFLIGIVSTHSLVITLFLIDIVAFFMFFFVDLKTIINFNVDILNINQEDFKKSIKLIKVCFPLFIVGLCYNIIPSIPRLIFERMYSAEEFGIYSSISTITVLISTAVNCIIVPIIPMISEVYKQKEKKKLGMIIWITTGLVTAFGMLSLLLVHLFGQYILVKLFGDKMYGYNDIFEWVTVSVVFTSLIICLNGFFAAVDKQVSLLWANIVGVMICVAIAVPLCKLLYMRGVALDLVVSQGVQIVILFILLGKLVKKIDKN